MWRLSVIKVILKYKAYIRPPQLQDIWPLRICVSVLLLINPLWTYLSSYEICLEPHRYSNDKIPTGAQLPAERKVAGRYQQLALCWHYACSVSLILSNKQNDYYYHRSYSRHTGLCLLCRIHRLICFERGFMGVYSLTFLWCDSLLANSMAKVGFMTTKMLTF